MMPRVLVAGALLWPAVLTAAWWDRAEHGGHSWTAVAYSAASRVCHQRPERSFETAGVQWPVCARCSGLYLAAPVGAVLGMMGWVRLRDAVRASLVAAALPTVATLGLEWSGVPIGNVVRAVSALPLGAIVAAVLVETTSRAHAIK
jgi:hypothetical protein